jgi:hypothetical protein
VGKRTYVCLNQEFSLRLNDYIGLAMFYGATYWKHRAYMEIVGNLHKEQPNERHERLLSYYLDNLLAMEVALQEVCVKVNIDVMAVKKLAGCEDEAAFSEGGNPGLVEGYTDLFMGFVE